MDYFEKLRSIRENERAYEGKLLQKETDSENYIEEQMKRWERLVLSDGVNGNEGVSIAMREVGYELIRQNKAIFSTMYLLSKVEIQTQIDATNTEMLAKLTAAFAFILICFIGYLLFR